MGLIRAGVSALGGTLADQWKDFLTVPEDLPPTAAFFPAVAEASTPDADPTRKRPEQ